MQQGAKANETGHKLENQIEAVLVGLGLESIAYKKWISTGQDEVIIKNFPYTSIYATQSRMEFFVYSSKLKLAARIECRAQAVPGSVNEKYPYLLLNALTADDHPDTTLIVTEGRGMGEGCKAWVRDYIGSNISNREISYFDGIEQFRSFVENRNSI